MKKIIKTTRKIACAIIVLNTASGCVVMTHHLWTQTGFERIVLQPFKKPAKKTEDGNLTAVVHYKIFGTDEYAGENISISKDSLRPITKIRGLRKYKSIKWKQVGKR